MKRSVLAYARSPLRCPKTPRSPLRYDTTRERAEAIASISNAPLEVHHLHLEGPTLHLLAGDLAHVRRGVVVVVAVDVLVFLREVLEPVVILVKLKVEDSEITRIIRRRRETSSNK